MGGILILVPVVLITLGLESGARDPVRLDRLHAFCLPLALLIAFGVLAHR